MGRHRMRAGIGDCKRSRNASRRGGNIRLNHSLLNLGLLCEGAAEDPDGGQNDKHDNRKPPGTCEYAGLFVVIRH
jgi:hypothetical protein